MPKALAEHDGLHAVARLVDFLLSSWRVKLKRLRDRARLPQGVVEFQEKCLGSSARRSRVRMVTACPC
jgi:hypothetical protein